MEATEISGGLLKWVLVDRDRVKEAMAELQSRFAPSITYMWTEQSKSTDWRDLGNSVGRIIGQLAGVRGAYLSTQPAFEGPEILRQMGIWWRKCMV